MPARAQEFVLSRVPPRCPRGFVGSCLRHNHVGVRQENGARVAQPIDVPERNDPCIHQCLSSDDCPFHMGPQNCGLASAHHGGCDARVAPLNHLERGAACRTRCAPKRPKPPRDRGRLATFHVSTATSTPNSIDRHLRSEVTCLMAKSRVVWGHTTRNKTFTRVDAQKSKINPTDCKSSTEEVRANKVRWESIFKCKWFCTKSTCSQRGPENHDSQVHCLSTPLHPGRQRELPAAKC